MYAELITVHTKSSVLFSEFLKKEIIKKKGIDNTPKLVAVKKSK
jgi:hypothetical protein